jgi:hypothetical protein
MHNISISMRVGDLLKATLASRPKNAKAVPLQRKEALWAERRYSSYSLSTSALDGGEWSASRTGLAFTPGERTPGTHCTGGWVGPRD